MHGRQVVKAKQGKGSGVEMRTIRNVFPRIWISPTPLIRRRFCHVVQSFFNILWPTVVVRSEGEKQREQHHSLEWRRDTRTNALNQIFEAVSETSEMLCRQSYSSPLTTIQKMLNTCRNTTSQHRSRLPAQLPEHYLQLFRNKLGIR